MYQCTKKNEETILFKVECRKYRRQQKFWITVKRFFVRSQVISKKYL